MKKILTVNPGSTATKFKLYDLKRNVLSEKVFLLKEQKQQNLFLSEITDLEKIAIRVVHGGDISETSKITKSLKKKIMDYIVFAPIHNARALEVIELLEKIFPKKSLYACFDTAFHTDMPIQNRTYPISSKISKKYKLVKYGFHGLALNSALSILKKIKKEKKQKTPKKIIFAHLGGGASITAVKNGKSFATSMGLTPLSGISMITRAGNIDPGIFPVLHSKGLSVHEISDILNHKSGFYGLTGSKDTKKIIEQAEQGSSKDKLATDIFISEIVQKIWAYAGLMQGVEAVVFSGGIGFGNEYLRNQVFKRIQKLGLTKKDIYVVDIDEEFVMFNQVKKLK